MMPPKYKESAKTLLLCLLLLCTFVLSARLWIFEELYAVTDTSDIANILLQRTGGFSPSNTLKPAGEDRLAEIFRPRRMIASFEANRSFITAPGASFGSYYSTVKEEMIRLFGASGAAVASVADLNLWRSAISQNSLFLDFGTSLSLRLLCQSLNVSLPAGGEDVEIRFGALHFDEAERVTQLVFKNDKSQAVYVLEGAYSERAKNLIAQMAQDEGQKKGAWFLFEREEADESGAALGLGAEQVFFDRPITQPVLLVQNPLSAEAADKARMVESISEAFLYNASTVKRYTTPEGAQLFVENFGTLRIDEGGLIEYHATQNDRGVALFSGSAAGAAILSRYDLVRSAYEMLFSLGKDLIGGEGSLQYYGMEYLSDEGCYRLYFGYTYGNYEIAGSFGENRKGHPISLDIADGYITAAVITARAFYPDAAQKEQEPWPLVLDMLRYSDYRYPVKGLDERYLYTEGVKNLSLSYCTQPNQ